MTVRTTDSTQEELHQAEHWGAWLTMLVALLLGRSASSAALALSAAAWTRRRRGDGGAEQGASGSKPSGTVPSGCSRRSHRLFGAASQ
ncbi:MAG: hypothetical protein U0531_10545 [Dehalococcoidia bacterium]